MGKLLVLEGLDGSGKSTQTERLHHALRDRNVPVRQIKLPDYDSDSSALVRMYLNGAFGTDPSDVNAYAASAFYAVDRFASFQTGWKQDYDSGTLILADRYVTSNAAYQMTKLPESDWDSYLSWLEDFEYGKLGLPEPSMVLFLDMPVEISQTLMSRRYDGDEGKKDVHESHVEYLQHCRKAALYAAARQNWCVIPCSDGSKPRSMDDIAALVLEAAEPLLKQGSPV